MSWRLPGWHKYQAKPTIQDGHRFASLREAQVYQNLKLQERAGLIAHLELQPRYILIVNSHRLGTYVADFRYLENGVTVVADAKGVQTPIYRLKKKLMLALYDIEITEL